MKRKSNVLFKIVLVAALAVLLFSGVQLYRIFLEYDEGTSEYEALQQEAMDFGVVLPQEFAPEIQSRQETSPEEETAGSGETDPPLVVDLSNLDHEKLSSINSDYVGWLALNETISYPVVQGSDDSFYLTHTFYGTKNKAGTLFMDSEIEDGWEADNVIIHGHNLKNNKMFAKLMNYEDQSFYEKNRYFFVYIPGEVRVYEIFSAYRTGEVSEAYQYQFAGSEDYAAFVELAQSRSTINTGVQIGEDEDLITLSTCTNVDNGRFVVHGRRIQ